MNSNNNSSSQKEAGGSANRTSNNQAKSTGLKSASKRTRLANQQSVNGAQSDKGKVVSPRPPATSSAMKEGSASQSKRGQTNANGSNFKDLSMRGAREEAKTIENPASGSGSAGQAKRGSRASTSNADLLKQSIRSEKLIKSSLNSKNKQQSKDKQSTGGGGQSQTSKNDGAGNSGADGQDNGNSMVKLVTTETEDTQALQEVPGNNNDQAQPDQQTKNVEMVKTVSFHENTEGQVASTSSENKPPSGLQKTSASATEENKTAMADSGNRTSVRTSLNGSAVPTSGNATLQQTAGLMHEEEDEEHYFGSMGGLDNNEEKDDPKRKFLFARQLTHYFEDNPPLPLLPKSIIRRSESPRTGGATNFLKLTRFRGQDFGKSKFREKEQEVERVQFPKEITTLKQIFQPLPPAPPQTTVASLFSKENTNSKPKKELKRQNSAKKDKSNNYQSGNDADGKGHHLDTNAQNTNSLQISSRIGGTNNATPQKGGAQAQKNFFSPNNLTEGKSRDNTAGQTANGKDNFGTENSNMRTQAGELVYQRQTIDFKTLNKQQKRDTVVEENLLDVKKLLKNAQVAANSKNPDEDDPDKKQLMKVNVEPFYTRKGPDDQTLIFESRFESGNLAAATKVNENEYHLLLQNDVNTGGHTQWYFFRTQNNKSIEVRFNMLNLCKPDSLYNEGMKILVYSEKMAALKDIGWHRAGTKISYYQNGIRKDEKKAANGIFRSYFTHTFTYDFEYDNDTVYFAYCYPYTFTDLTDDINKIMADPIKAQFTTRKTLCQTLAGNPLEILTITSKQNPENMAKRKGVVLTARVHPGESVGSWMMKGALDFLTSTDIPEAEILRQNFVFKVIPMLNPDGVINGNYRCSLAGCDLNRRWKAPSKVLHPTIYYTKQMIHNFVKERELLIFTDFHGHSRRKNIFMYGCNIPHSPEDTRIFPFILSNICPFFIYNYSRFGNQKSKESTARMALFNELKQHPAIYTVESSFCGNDVGKFAKYHFSTDNLCQTGADFCRALLIYAAIPAPLSVLEGLFKNINGIYSHYQIINDQMQPIERDPDIELMKLYKEKMEQMQESGVAINTAQIKKALLKVLRQHSDVQTDGESTSSAGSDNAPSEDNLKPEEIAEVVPIMEDPEVAKAVKKNKANEKADIPKGPTSSSPLKKRSTTIGPNQKGKGQINLLATRNLKSNKKQSDLSGRKSQKGSVDGKNSEGGSSRKGGEKGADATADGNIVTDENVVHKKKLKKNVESRDACTQTERSDYYLIKQRQKQKEIMMMAKQGLLPPGVNPQALMQSYIQSQNQGIPFLPMEAIQKQLAQAQAQAQANGQVVVPQQMSHSVTIPPTQKQQMQNQNQLLRQQILVGAANNAAAALYQQQMNQAYYVQMQQYSQQQQQMLQQMKATGQGPPQTQVSQSLQHQPLTGQPGHQQPQMQQPGGTAVQGVTYYNHPNRNVHSSYSPQKNRKDATAPHGPNVYSNSSTANSIINNVVQQHASQQAVAPIDGVQRTSASRGGTRVAANANMMNPHLQQPQTIEMSKTAQDQGKVQQAMVNSGGNQWMQGKIGSKELVNTSNSHVNPGIAGQHVHHGGVIASMNRKPLVPPSKPGNQPQQVQGPQTYIAGAMFNPPKGMTPNPGALVLTGQPNHVSRQNHSINPQATTGLPHSNNSGNDTLPDILMQSPNPTTANKMKTKQHGAAMYTGPLNRTQNPTQIERLQVNHGGFSQPGSQQSTAQGVSKMQKVTTQGVPNGVAISVDGIHQHHQSNGQLLNGISLSHQQQQQAEWRQRAIQNGKSQDNLHPKDLVMAVGDNGYQQPASAQLQGSKLKGGVLENQFIKQTLEKQKDQQNTDSSQIVPASKKSAHQTSTINQNSYIRNVGNNQSHSQQNSGTNAGSRANEKVKYIQHGDVLERRVKKRVSNTDQGFMQNRDGGANQHPGGINESNNGKQGGQQQAQGRSHMDQYRGGLHHQNPGQSQPSQPVIGMQGQYQTPSKPASRGGGVRGVGGSHPAQNIQQQAYGGASSAGMKHSKAGANAQQFFHVQRIIPANMETGGAQGGPQMSQDKGGQGVKINIVNVHNEFNIQNNIIIQQPSMQTHPQGSSMPGTTANQGASKKHKKSAQSQPATKTSQSGANKIQTKK